MRTVIRCGLMLAVFVYGQEQAEDERDPRLVIEKIRTEYLIRELELDPEQASEFSARLGELRDIESEFRRARAAIIEELRTLLETGAAYRSITKVLDRHERIMRKRAEDQVNKMMEIREMLSPAQQARFIIATEKFETGIKEMIREVKRRCPGPDE